MNYQVSNETKENTERCPNKFKCLEDSKFKLCPVIDFIRTEKLLFVDGKYNFSCSYRLHFADADICRCPVRFELYKKYKR